ncbi:MAG TPA: hypothetical protein VN729_11390 [Ktedonobacteraceae bacterium]|nr:hypothetical protein [Ktedonobacteraceae bacterium]
MRNDSIETLLLRHYGSSAPAPVDLEQQLSAMVRQETAATQARQEVVNNWQQPRVSRRRVLQLVTFSGAGLSVVAVGLNALQGKQKPAYSV